MSVGGVPVTVSLAMRYRARRSTGRSIQWSKLKKKAEQFCSLCGRTGAAQSDKIPWGTRPNPARLHRR